jgi:hypothetical protein
VREALQHRSGDHRPFFPNPSGVCLPYRTMPFMKFLSTSKRAARVITKILVDASGQTGVYYDEGGHPMLGSALVRDPKFTDKVVAETRALLSNVPT